MLLTIPTVTLDEWQYAEANPKLRARLSHEMVAVDNLGKTLVIGSSPDYYMEWQLTTGTRTDATGRVIKTVTLPQVAIYSTRDAVGFTGAYWIFEFFDAAGNLIGPYKGFTRVTLPGSFAGGSLSPTWDQVYTFNHPASPILVDRETLNREQILQLVGSVIAGVSSFNSRTGAITLASSDVSNALGYTPLSQASADSMYSHLGHSHSALDISSGVLPLTRGGLGVALVDPDIDMLLFWDDSAGQFQFLTLGSGLSITGTTISVTGGGGGGGGDMLLGTPQTITAAKTFNPTTLVIGGQSSAPTVVAKSFYFNNTDGRLYFGKGDGSAWSEVYLAGVSGPVSVPAGGTGVATLTGLVKGNGTSAFSAATAGTDYVAPGALTGSGLTMSTAKLLGRSSASSGAVEELTIGSGLSLSGGTLTATGGGGGGGYKASDATSLYLRDDFLQGTANSGSIGETNFSSVAINGSATLSYQSATTVNFGILRIATNGASADAWGIATRDNIFKDLSTMTNWDLTIVARLNQTANIRVYLGFNNDKFNDSPTNFVGVRFDSFNDSKFTFVTSNSGTSTTSVTNSINVDTNFHKFRVRSTTAGHILFSIDGGGETEITTNIPNNAMALEALITALAASVVSLDIDFIGLDVTGISR